MKAKKYDVAIIGSGPAGMSAALELIRLKPNFKIVILEKGPIRKQEDRKNRNLITIGWGGAGTFSDGKLCLTSKVGGCLSTIIEEQELNDLVVYVDQQYLSFGGNKGSLIPLDLREAKKLRIEAFGAGFKDFVYYEVRHWGTDNAYFICENIRQYLISKGVDIFCNTEIAEIEKTEHFLLTSKDNNEFRADIVILAMGRSGNRQIGRIARKYGLTVKDNGVDIGLRLETSAEAFEKFTDIVQDPKLILLHASRLEVRTFCVCPYGFVKLEATDGVISVNGESYSKDSGIKSPNTNFAILVHRNFTEPFNDPIEYGRMIAMLANKLGKTVLVQSLSDFLIGRRSTRGRIERSGVVPTLKEAEPGSIGSVMPYDFMMPLVAMMEALMKIAPINPDILLMYAAEVKNYAEKVQTIGASFETEKKGLYVAGDGSGYTRGIMQASMQGILVARDIANKI